jgi:hypothetical protein
MMAKKKNENAESTTAPRAPVRRRSTTTRKKGAAAAPVDVASIAATEPDTAADMRTAPPNPAGDDAYQPTYEEIAERAYHRYLQRGGSPGSDFNDWVEAERELRQRRR